MYTVANLLVLVVIIFPAYSTSNHNYNGANILGDLENLRKLSSEKSFVY